MASIEHKKSANAEIEESVLASWQKEDTFAKSLKLRQGGPVFSFYDGPPFANGMPHFGHSLVTSIKDSIGRYKTMRGYHVERRNGWDCHGLPVEFAVEKQLGISGKKQILKMGLAKFNQACRDSVFTYKADHEAFFQRIGRWTDTEHAYATIDRDYTESVWWVMKQVYDKGLLYKGFKSLAYCPRCETPLSNFEVNEGYRDDVDDPSLFVKFKLVGEDASLLGWTTTPWSLPGNAAIAVNPGEKYVYVQMSAEKGKVVTLVLAKKRLKSVLKGEIGYKIVKEVSGQVLVGKAYKPLFKLSSLGLHRDRENLYKVWPAQFVSVEDGTGVLHVAPAFGEDDLNLSNDNGFPVLTTVDSSGHIEAGIGFDEVKGQFFKDADRPIIKYLTKHGHVFAAETIKHTYPFCYRCDSPLLYYAVDTWFIKVSSIRPQLLKTAKSINWVPAHIKDGRFGKWLEGARDWAISRNRYWGAPMPIWANVNDPNDYLVVGSIKELEDLAGTVRGLDLHRPFIDTVVIKKDGKIYKRIEEVIDCWFESGSMPVAQQHYPFENKAKFDASFPADYIGEGLDQTRLWFYVQHVLSTILFDKPAYKNVLVNGMILAADGEKLSKRLENYPPLSEVFNDEGADSLRLYLLSNNQALGADYMRFDRSGVKDMNRNVIGTLLNSYRFFKMYADIDGWAAPSKLAEPSSKNILDQWMLSRLNQTIAEVTKQADTYKLAHAIQPIFLLIDDMSNWFIRRSRRRFWKSDNDADKAAAYSCLHFTMVRTCQLLAPWAPFVSDHIYSQLMDGESLHLSDWPKAGKVDADLVADMQRARLYIADGLAKRAQAKIKVRQPLKQVIVPVLPDAFADIIRDELNVKEVLFSKKLSPDTPDTVSLNVTLTEALRAEGMMRELVRMTQNLRKTADLQVDDRITLNIDSTDKLVRRAVDRFADQLKQETLAIELVDETQTHRQEVKVDGVVVKISLSKTNS